MTTALIILLCAAYLLILVVLHLATRWRSATPAPSVWRIELSWSTGQRVALDFPDANAGRVFAAHAAFGARTANRIGIRQ